MHLEQVRSPAQIEQCALLAEAIWHAYYTPIIGEAQVAYMLEHFQSAEAIASQCASGYRYDLLYDGDRAVGYCATVPEGDALKISKLYLLETHRGRGGGRLMLEMCEHVARSRRFGKLLLTVNRHNPALVFYEKMGFANAGKLVQEIGGGFVMDDYVMLRAL